MPDGYRPAMGCELELAIANYEASKLTRQFERPADCVCAKRLVKLPKMSICSGVRPAL
jgi:hypothetical protein